MYSRLEDSRINWDIKGALMGTPNSEAQDQDNGRNMPLMGPLIPTVFLLYSLGSLFDSL